MLQERDLPDHYRLWRREDGSTGLAPGRVYKATDRRTGGIVALRLFDAGTVWAETLMRRGNLLSKTELPHVTTLRDVFTQDDTLVVVSDFVIGESLGERLRRRGPMDAGAVRAAALQAVEALAALHARGVQHGSLGASNILFPDDPQLGGALVLVDAGLDPEAGANGAPEDFRRLGICLWHALTGEFPFGGELPAATTGGSADLDKLLTFFAWTLCGEPDRQPDVARGLLDALRTATEPAKTAAPPVTASAAVTAGAAGTSAPAPVGTTVAPVKTSALPVTAAIADKAAAQGPSLIPLTPRGVDKAVANKAGVLVAEPRPVPIKTGQPTVGSPASKSETAPPTSTAATAADSAKTDASTNSPPSGKSWRITGLILALAALGTAAALAFTHYDWLMGRTNRAETEAVVSTNADASVNEASPTPKPMPTPPRTPASRARIDRIKELQPGLLDVLKFVTEMRLVATLPVPDAASVPEEAEIERLKAGFEWTSPSSPNYHRTVMLLMLGYEKGALTPESVAESQHCADALAATLTSGGMTCAMHTCGMGNGQGLPEIAPPVGEAGRFVEVWAAFTLF